MKAMTKIDRKKKIYQLHSRAFDLLQKVEAATKQEKARHRKQVGDNGAR